MHLCMKIEFGEVDLFFIAQPYSFFYDIKLLLQAKCLHLDESY